MLQTLKNLIEAYHFLHVGERMLSSIGLEIHSGDEALGDSIYGAYDFISDAIANLLEVEAQDVIDILINTTDVRDVNNIAIELIKLPVACKNGFRKVKLIFFKEHGKYYASEERRFPEHLQAYEIVDAIKEKESSYKGMHVFIQFHDMDNIGYSCLVLAQDRR